MLNHSVRPYAIIGPLLTGTEEVRGAIGRVARIL